MSKLYIIPDPCRIEESLALAKKYDAHFEYNDFFMPAFLDDEDALQQRIDFYKSLNRDRHLDTLHGVFLDMTIHSDDALIRQVSDRRMRQSMEIAKELDCRGVIFHTNMISNFKSSFYMDNWVERNVAYFTQLLEDYPSLEIYLENMFDDEPTLLQRVGVAMKHHPRFGICFDYAHANVFGDGSEQWCEALCPLAYHMHINDNDGKVDLHEAVGQCHIDWTLYNERMHHYQVNASVLIEVSAIEKQEASLNYMKQHHLYPFTGEND